MIFSDREIEAAVADRRIKIDPFWAGQLNPASFDLTLHPILRLTRDQHRQRNDAGRWVTPPILDLWDRSPDASGFEPYTREHILFEGEPSYDIWPGEFLLASTEEYIKLGPETVGRVEGKSSLARVGLAVHVTGGFIDPGFEGQITLEIANLFPRPVRIYSGMRIAQIAFQGVRGQVKKAYDKTGRYHQQQGPTESRYTYTGMPTRVYSCSSCGWVGTYTDWRNTVDESRYCPGCQDPQMVCRDDHCLECGAST